MRRRRLAYLTGTRADFGLMVPTLRAIAASDAFKIELLVTGMHLSEQFGSTLREVEQSGLPIAATIPVPIDDDSGLSMSHAAAEVLRATASFLADRPSDALIVLGDRWEMLAATQAALYMGVPVVHLCGGDRSGSIDDSIRHAITRLAHLHFVASGDAEQRILAMGEEAWRVHLVGAPGLAGLRELASRDIGALAGRDGFDPARPFALLLFHPVVQDAATAGDEAREAIAALQASGLQTLCLLPNADTGSAAVRSAIDETGGGSWLHVVDHLARAEYSTALAHARVLVGNSSSGIVEAATLGTAVVNIGERQRGRLTSANVFHAEPERIAITAAIRSALAFDATGLVNVYGTDDADRRTVELLESIDLSDSRLLKKMLTY